MNSPNESRQLKAIARPINAIEKPSVLEMLAFAALGGVIVGVASRRGRNSPIAKAAGFALMGMAARPFVTAAITRAGARRRNVVFNSSVEIARPIPEVFAFFKDFENFPRVIGAVRSVIDYQDGRSHWEVYTPSGSVLSWDAVVTKYVPNSVIAWESVVRSLVESRGVARFTALSPTKTRVDLSVAHHPVATTLQDAVRALLATDPRKTVANNLDHIRFYLESMPSRRIAATSEPSPEPTPSTTETDSQSASRIPDDRTRDVPAAGDH
jgi:uncharacterized membrane protein